MAFLILNATAPAEKKKKHGSKWERKRKIEINVCLFVCLFVCLLTREQPNDEIKNPLGNSFFNISLEK
jgi:hypothetical protein